MRGYNNISFEKSFIDYCLAGKAKPSDIDKYIAYWHSHNIGCTLQEFLGLTDNEYEEWAKSPDKFLEELIRDRKNYVNRTILL